MKTYIPGNYELITIDEDYNYDRIDTRICNKIDYTYYIEEDGRFVSPNGNVSVKAGDIVLFMYPINDRCDCENCENRDKCTNEDCKGKAILLEDGLLKQYLTKAREVDKKRQERQNRLSEPCCDKSPSSC